MAWQYVGPEPEFVNRVDAVAAGLTRYYTGPCKRGHKAPRITKTCKCSACEIQSGIARIGKWRAANPEKRILASRRTRGASIKRNPLAYWARAAHGAARSRAAEKGIPFDITSDYVISICPTHCPALGCEIAYRNPRRAVWNSANLDRIIPSLGYVVGNVQVICRRANFIKTDASVEEIMRAAIYFSTLNTTTLAGGQ